MMMNNIRLGVTLLALVATASAAQDGVQKKRGQRKLIRKNNRNNIKNRRRATNNKDADITEDVAFWTRTLQAGSIPPSPPTRRPTRPVTRRPTARPQANVTPRPTTRPTRPPTRPPVQAPVPAPTNPPVPVEEPTYFPTYTPTEGSGGGATPVARDDTASMSIDEGIIFVSVLENDTPATGTELGVTNIVTQATNGDCTISLEITEVVYSPNGAGTDSCVYEACDDATPPACDTATLTITVTN